MFEWSDIRYFLAVARHGSTVAAAKALGLSQSTVHRRLLALEKQLNCRIVRRHPTGYRLTQLGEELRIHGERIEEAVSAFARHIAVSDHDVSGVIRVTCPEVLGSRLVRTRLIDKFNKRYPHLRVELVMSDRLLDLAKGEADVAFRGTIPRGGSLFGRKIARSPWAIYASTAYVEQHGGIERIEDIGRHAIVKFDGEMRNHPAMRWLQSAAPRAKISARGSGLPAVMMAVKSGAGIAAMPAITAENEEDLVCLYGPLADLPTDFYVLIHEDMKRTPRVRAFFDFVIAELPTFRSILTPQHHPRTQKAGAPRRRQASRRK